MGTLKRLGISALALLFVGEVAAIDASSCSSAARKLHREARDLESAADDLESAEEGQKRQAQQEVSDKASEVRSLYRKVASECGGGSAFPASYVTHAVTNYLTSKHGSTEAGRKRIQALRPHLEQLARTHVRYGATELHMTFAMADLLFQNYALEGQ